MRLRNDYLIIAAAAFLLTSCSDENTITQEPPVSTELSFTETTQKNEPLASELLPETLPPITGSASETEQAIETTETTEPPLPYELDADAELDFSSFSEQAKVLHYDECYQAQLIFQDFQPELSEDYVLFHGFMMNSEEDVRRYKELYTEALKRSIREGTELTAPDEYRQAMELIDNMTEQYPSEDYVYLANCEYYSKHWGRLLGMDIVADGEMLTIIRRHEESNVTGDVPALEPQQYLWIAAVPRAFLSEEHYTDWQS